MKRLNTIFFTGLLCFSLGYIAHDISGESGGQVVGAVVASPISPLFGSTKNFTSKTPLAQQLFLINNSRSKKELCTALQFRVLGELADVIYTNIDNFPIEFHLKWEGRSGFKSRLKIEYDHLVKLKNECFKL